ncbi:hypothetical protein ACLKA7_005067 [Drosophila subpalustris]
MPKIDKQNSCWHCAEDLGSQGIEPSERTHLLADSVNQSPALRRSNSADLSNEYSQSLPKKDDQNALSRLVQNTAINMINVGALDSHNLEHQEYTDRIKLYSQRLQQQWNNVQHPCVVLKGLLKDVPNPQSCVSKAIYSEDTAQDLGVKHQYTAPYTPQENPTERANRTVKTMIAQFAGANQRCWDEALPEITLAVNTSVTASTGYSPAFVTQGRDLGFHKHYLMRSLEKAAQDQARHYNLRRRSWKPSVGDKVWLKEHHLSNAAEGFAAKLAPRFGGPFRVVDFVSPVIDINYY